MPEPGGEKIKEELGRDDQHRKAVGGGRTSDSRRSNKRRQNFGGLHGGNEPQPDEPVPDIAGDPKKKKPA
jgi:hypothetical protein